ncbi:MAG: hypothetical protein ACK515_01295 [bacterium]|jgi:opacity protein-like surface antigen|nr:hypothetical protein [Betaproteobacteria bacterium]
MQPVPSLSLRKHPNASSAAPVPAAPALRVLAAATAAALCAAMAPAALAQTTQQKVTPPVAVYWVSAETRGGMGGMPGGAAGVLGGLLGGGAGSPMQGGRSMVLELGSARTAGGEPAAAHEIPAGMNMGPSLPLLTPRTPPPEPRGEETDTPPRDFEKPKGRMLIYWGCGDATRSGQPIVIDFAKIASGQMPKFPAVRINNPRGPSFGRNRTFGHWPNAETRMTVPGDASLRGDHLVKGNYSPDIRFSVTERTDFMQAPSFQPVTRTAGGGLSVQWQSIPNATGYAMSAMGANAQQDLVIWSSSELADMGWGLNSWLSPTEVARLIKERVVLPPSTTECTVPAEVVREAGTPMLTFIGYGDELNVVHPPRPTDPRVTWEQQYAVKVRQRTTGMLMLAEGDAGGRPGARGRREQPAPDGGDAGSAQRAPAAPTVTDVIKEGVGGVLRGLFGR